MSGELETLEWRDALSGEKGQSELNSHYVAAEYEFEQAIWPKHREWIMEKLDHELGMMIIEGLKRGWRAISFERWTWNDADWPELPSFPLLLGGTINDYTDGPASLPPQPPIPEWLRVEVYGLSGWKHQGLYHIRTRITVVKP